MSATGADGRRKNRELQGWARQRPLTARTVREPRSEDAGAVYTRPALLHYGRAVRSGTKGPKSRVGGSKPTAMNRRVRSRSKARAAYREARSLAARARHGGSVVPAERAVARFVRLVGRRSKGGKA